MLKNLFPALCTGSKQYQIVFHLSVETRNVIDQNGVTWLKIESTNDVKKTINSPCVSFWSYIPNLITLKLALYFVFFLFTCKIKTGNGSTR